MDSEKKTGNITLPFFKNRELRHREIKEQIYKGIFRCLMIQIGAYQDVQKHPRACLHNNNYSWWTLGMDTLIPE